MSTIEEIKQKLAGASVSPEAIGLLEQHEMLEEALLIAATDEQLQTKCGLSLGAAMKVKGLYPSVVQESEMAQLVKAMSVQQSQGFETLGKMLTDSAKLQNHDLCVNIKDDGSVCGFLLPKGFSENCPGCGKLTEADVVSCGLCGTEVPSEIKNAVFCVGCGLKLYTGDQLDAAKHLIHSGVATVDLGDKLAAAQAHQMSDWSKRGRKIRHFVVTPTTEVHSVSDALRSFREPTFLDTVQRGLDIRIQSAWKS